MAVTLRESAVRFLPLTPQVFQVLLSLHQGSLHGYSIIQDVRERTGGKMRLTASTLYDALARLVEQGLIEETDRSDATSGEDARRRYYRLTRLGRQVTQEEVTRLQQLIQMARGSGVTTRETGR